MRKKKKKKTLKKKKKRSRRRRRRRRRRRTRTGTSKMRKMVNLTGVRRWKVKTWKLGLKWEWKSIKGPADAKRVVGMGEKDC